ncbi:MAG: PqqD family protein [Bacteroidetes bacterium]|nr:MAG: PqqD family protein [Bacteroidota bacterium]
MIVKLKKNIAISESGFVFDPTSGESFSLNPIAIEILNMLKEGKGQGDISGFVLNKYEVERDTFENNYFDFVGMIKQFNLLENN